MDHKARAARRKARVLEKLEERDRLVSGLESVENSDPWQQRKQRQTSSDSYSAPKSQTRQTSGANSRSSPKNLATQVKSYGNQQLPRGAPESATTDQVPVHKRDKSFLPKSSLDQSTFATADFFAESLYLLGIVFMGCAFASASINCTNKTSAGQDGDGLFGSLQQTEAHTVEMEAPAAVSLACYVASGSIQWQSWSLGWIFPSLVLLRVAALTLGKALIGWESPGGALYDIGALVKMYLPGSMGANVDSALAVVSGTATLHAVNVAVTTLLAVLRDSAVLYTTWGIVVALAR